MMQQGQQWHEALAAQLEQVQAAEVEEQVQAAEVDGLTAHRLRQNARWLLEPSNRDWGVGRRNSRVGPKVSIHGHCLIFHARVWIPKLQGVLNAFGLAHGMVAVDMLVRVVFIQ